MAQTLDLEEQEQLDQLKHFWRRYGNLITLTLTLVFGGVAAWNGWQFWQHRQAVAAAALFDELERAVADRETERLQRVLSDLQSGYGRTAYATQGALLAARGWFAAGQTAPAQSALEWVVAKSSDEGMVAVSRLRLAALALERGAPQEAATLLDKAPPPAFKGLFADRKGDVHLALNQRAEAKAAFLEAHAQLDARSEYRRLVEVKLEQLGVDPQSLSDRK